MDPRASLASHIKLLVLLGTLALAGSSAAAQPATPDAQNVAREAYAAGVAAFQRRDHEQALVNFMAADEAVSSPNVKLMLGRTLIQLQRRIDAHATLAAAVREAHAAGTRYDQSASAAAEELRQLEQTLAMLTLRVDDPTGGASLRVAGREIPREEWAEPIVTEPGAIEIALVGAQGEQDVKQVEMTGGAAAALAMLLPERAPATVAAPAPLKAAVPSALASTGHRSEPPRLRTLSYAAAGVGAAGIVECAILGALSNAQFAKLDAACPDRTQCSAALKQHANRGQTYQTLANVSLAVGVAALTAGVVLWVIGLPGEHAQLSLTPQSAQLSGAF